MGDSIDPSGVHPGPLAMSRRNLVRGALASGVALVGGLGTARAVRAINGGITSPATGGVPAARGVARQVDDTLPPPSQPRNWEPGWFITNVVVDSRMMALTFDDGPSPYNTYPLLRTLAQKNVKATFYLIGVNVRSFPDVARAIVDEGHELGNHSVYHTPYQAYALSTQVGTNQNIIQDETGVRPVTHRAPGLTKGSSVLSACQYHGLYETHTHMSTFDWIAPRYSASTLYSQFVQHHRNGALPIYHDGGPRRPTPDAMPAIIDYAKSVGYELMTASELVARGRPAPGWMSYDSRNVESVEPGSPSASRALTDDVDQPYVDTCDYDARAALEARLEDPTVKRAERSRIVEVLAEMDGLEAG